MRNGTLPVKGLLNDFFIGEVICHFFRESETGILEVFSHGVRKRLFFEEGRILFAETSDPDERLGLFLLRRKKVTYRSLEDCAAKVRPNQRFGGVLVLEGYLQPEDLYQGVVGQIKEIILGLFECTTGEYEFHRGPLAGKEVITLNLSVPDLIIAGTTRIWRWSLIWKGIGSLDAVIRKHEAWSIVARNLTPTPDTRMLLDLFDRPRTLEEILQLSSLGDFETCRLVWAFLMLGIVEEILVAPKWEAELAQQEPVPAAAGTTTGTPDPSNELVEQADADRNQKSESGDSTARIRWGKPEAEEDEIDDRVENDFDELDAEWDTQSMPLVRADDLKKFAENQQLEENTEKLSVLQPPSTELSFADLAELTDAVNNEELQARAETGSDVDIRKEDVLPELNRFNEVHRYLFEMVQLELGPKVSEFLSRAFIKASTRFPLVFEGVRVNEYGELSERTMMTNVEVNLVQNLPEALRFLLREERALIRSFLDPRRVDLIEAGLEDVEEGMRSTDSP